MTKLTDDQIAHMVAHSYPNLHTKGLHYLCLKRSPELTRKVYLFNDECVVNRLGDVVAPHDHRYDFRTTVLAGEMSESIYEVHPYGEPYHRFAYTSPLLSDNPGFKLMDTQRLLEVSRVTYKRAQWLDGSKSIHFTPGRAIHTIRIHRPGTILLLEQYADFLPAGTPTHTWSRNGEPKLMPNDRRFTEDEVIKLYQRYEEALGA